MLKLNPTTFEETKEFYLAHYWSLVGGYDDYIEDLLIEGHHVSIVLDEKDIGVFAYSKDNKLIYIVILGQYSAYYEQVFDLALTYGSISGIITTTNDPLMMTNMIRRNISFEKQGYNFVLKNTPKNDTSSINFVLAKEQDIPKLKELFKDFFDEYQTPVKEQRLFIGFKETEIVSLGHIKAHHLSSDVVSIGMIVEDAKRTQGIGTETISFLIQEGVRRKCIVQAGCWYYNHASKKTLVRAGLDVVSLIVRADEL